MSIIDTHRTVRSLKTISKPWRARQWQGGWARNTQGISSPSNTAIGRRSRFRDGLCSLLVLMLLTACAVPRNITLDNTWPEKPDSYSPIRAAWTRTGIVRGPGQQVLEVYATFKSPAWRAAYVERSAKQQGLSPALHAALEQAQKDAAKGAYELHLLITTYERRENDLDRGERSIWRLALRDDRGNEVAPLAIARDRRPLDVVRGEFPDLGDFAVPYVVTFPRTIEILRPDARYFELLIGSSRGSVVLRWEPSK